MPDLIIKPAAQSGNKVIIQDQAGGAVITTADSGIASIKLAPTATGSAPSGTAGTIYYDSDKDCLMQYDGTSWRKLPGGGIATGGTTSTTDGYKYHTFTSSGTFTVTGTATLLCDILVVGGGGGGGYWGGCGGGGSAVYERRNFPLVAGAYTVTIGAGGTSKSTGGSAAAGVGINGANSLLGTEHIGFGGGGGGASDFHGLDGGCGGGRDDDGSNTNTGKGIESVSPGTILMTHAVSTAHIAHSFSVTPTQGSNSSHNGSGGGGAGGLNGTWSTPNMTSPGHAGNGGIGKYISWVDHLAGTNTTNGTSGTRGYFGGGGHGLSSNTEESVPGGAGEGGIVNTGGGANGDKAQIGGSGIVIVRYV